MGKSSACCILFNKNYLNQIDKQHVKLFYNNVSTLLTFGEIGVDCTSKM